MNMRSGAALGAAFALAGWLANGRQLDAGPQAAEQQQGSQAAASRVTKEQFGRWMTELSNWGRWGKDDQLGALNLITPAKRQQASALVKTGTVISLARVLTAKKLADAPPAMIPGSGGWFGSQVVPSLTDEWAGERQLIEFHGGAITHVDALCHVAYNGKIYNGLRFADVVKKDGGCSKNSVIVLKDGIVTRGILLDMPGKSVRPADVQAWEQRTGVKIAPGDALFLRTGRGKWEPAVGAGYDASMIPLFKQRDVAIIGADVAQEGAGIPDVSIPIHRFAIVALGVHLFDNLELDALAATATKLNRWEFLLMAAPLPVSNGSGSAINPIAVF